MQIWFNEYFPGLALERVFNRSFPTDLSWAQCKRTRYGAVESVRKVIQRVKDDKVIVMNDLHSSAHVANVNFSMLYKLLFILGHRFHMCLTWLIDPAF